MAKRLYWRFDYDNKFYTTEQIEKKIIKTMNKENSGFFNMTFQVIGIDEPMLHEQRSATVDMDSFVGEGYDEK